MHGFKMRTHDIGWVRPNYHYNIIISERPSVL